MKLSVRVIRVWFLVWFAAALVVGTASAADVTFNTVDLVGSAINSRPLRIVPIDTPRIDGSAIVTGERYATNTRSGVVTITNLTAGYYRCEIAGTWTNTTFVIRVPTTNATYTAAELLTSSSSVPSGLGYTRAQVDALIAAIPASTNSSSGAFTTDGNGDLTPTTGSFSDSNWQTDSNSDLTPK